LGYINYSRKTRLRPLPHPNATKPMVDIAAASSNGSTVAAATSKSNPWKDVPQRLATIFIALPLLWNVWQRDGLRLAFFQSVHLLCALEWSLMTMWSKSKSSSQSKNRQTAKGVEESPSLWNSIFFVSEWRVWLFPAVSCSLANISSPNCFLLGLVLILALPTVLLVPPTSDATSSTAATTTTLQQPLTRISTALAWHQGSLFITIPFRTWLLLTRGPHGFVPTVSLLLTVWNCDTGALVTGRLWSSNRQWPTSSAATACQNSTLNRLRRKLYAISPNKSVEGWCGALVAGTLTYVLLVPMLWTYLGQVKSHTGSSFATTQRNHANVIVWEDFMVGLGLSVAAILGDTWESAVKRHYRVKDTSRFLPGHGGILDRFDSSLIAVLVQHVYLETSARARNRGY
jgi:CDP-diglyceride synthetase